MSTQVSFGLTSFSPLTFTPYTPLATLTTPESWTLLPVPAAVSFTPAPSTSAPTIPCPVVAKTEADFLAMFDRVFPVNYLGPIKTFGPGYEAFQAIGATMARASQSVADVGCDSFILTSAAGTQATGTVQLLRAQPIPDGVTTVTVKKGTAVASSRGSRIFLTTDDVVFAPTDLGPHTVGVIALADGYDWNLPGQVIAADGEALPGDIDTMVQLIESPDFGDPTIEVTQAVPTSGGRDAALDQHGADRGLPRHPGENDQSYKIRIRTLPDTISPDAMDRAARQALFPFKGSFSLVETWDINYQTCYDAPADAIPGSDFDPNLFVYDDPRSPIPFRGRWLDENDHRGAFFVVVPQFQPISDFGMWFDSTEEIPTDFISPITGGYRSVSAYDIPASGLSAAVHPGFYDGFDPGIDSTYSGLYEVLQSIKAAGVQATLELSGQ